MRIIWYGHSCFKISEGGYSVVLDPYKPNMIPGLGKLDLTANEVLCSHEHGDHNNRDAVTLARAEGPSPFSIRRIPSFHDAEHGARRGANVITLLTAGGLRAVHCGDLGCPLTPEQVGLLRGADVLMVPVGGFYTIGADEAKRICDQLDPRVVIPMHYRGPGFGPGVIDGVDRFLDRFEPSLVKRLDADAIDVGNTTPRQVAVLRFAVNGKS